MDALEFAAVAGLAAVVPLAFILILLRRLRRTRRERDDIEGEEHRLFGFLHLLGQAIEEDYTTRKLYRVITEGLEEVLGADGAALYLVSPDGVHLVPASVTDGFHPLDEVPEELRGAAAHRSGKLVNHLRLAKLPAREGVLGRCLRRGEAMRIHDHPEFGSRDGSVVEVMLAPVTHAGRDLGVLAVTGGGASADVGSVQEIDTGGVTLRVAEEQTPEGRAPPPRVGRGRRWHRCRGRTRPVGTTPGPPPAIPGCDRRAAR